MLSSATTFKCDLFHQTSSCVQSYQKRSFMRAQIVLKRRFFSMGLMSPENPCLSLFYRSWFRRHRYTSQWTGFHQLCKFPYQLPILWLACFLICRSHRWKQQEGLFSTRLAGSQRTAQSCVGLAVTPLCLSKHASGHRSGVGGSNIGILLHWLTGLSFMLFHWNVEMSILCHVKMTCYFPNFKKN